MKDWRKLEGFGEANGWDAQLVIDKMTAPDNEHPEQYIMPLMKIVSYGESCCQLTVYVFEELVEQLYMTEDMETLSVLFVLLGRIKTMVWSSDVMSYPEETRDVMLSALHRLSQFTSEFFDPEEIRKMEPDNKRDFGFFYMMLCNQSHDLMALYPLYPFDNALHIRCPYCGDDIHSIHLEEHADLITLRDTLWQEEGQWDVFSRTVRFLDEIGETGLKKQLQGLYGTLHCPVCGKESRFIDMIQSHRHVTAGEPVPSEELVRWLLETGNLMQDEGYAQMYYYHQAALNYWYSVPGASLQLQGEIYLALAKDYAVLSNRERRLFCAKKAQEAAAQMGDKVLLAKSWVQTGMACRSRGPGDEGDPAKALDYLTRARALFAETLGEEDRHCRRVDKDIALLKLDTSTDPEASIALLEQQIRQEEKEEMPDVWVIANAYEAMAELYAEGLHDYDNAIRCYKEYMEQAQQEYGEQSDYVADCCEEMGWYYSEKQDWDNACRYYERALGINVREMGKVYLLPPLFKHMADTARDFVGTMDREDRKQRSLSAAGSFDHLGKIYLHQHRAQEALDCFIKGRELRQWVEDFPSVEEGDSCLLMAQCYEELLKPRKAAEAIEKARKIYELYIEENEQTQDEEQLQKVKVCKEKLESLSQEEKPPESSCRP